MRLNELRDNPGAARKKLRIGRGLGSGKGKTGGRGQKGQKSRDGVSINGFEGGQMPLYMRLPKRGFKKPNRAHYAELTLKRLQVALDSGKLDAGQDIDEDALVAAGVIRRKLDGVRLVATGELTKPVRLTVTGVTEGARAAVEKAGGAVTLVTRYVDVTLGQLQKAIEKGELDASKAVDEDALIAADIIKRKLSGVRLVALGRLSSKITLTVTAADDKAREAVEREGGAVTTTGG